MLGSPLIASTMKRTGTASRPLISWRYTAVRIRERDDDDGRDADLLERADDRVLRAAARGERPDLAQVFGEERATRASAAPLATT